MFALHPPSDLARTAFRMKQSRLSCSYSPVGCTTSNRCPEGYVADRAVTIIGQGREDFESACYALRAWKQFPSAWTFVDPPDSRIEVDTVVTMMARTYGLWTLNACRIVDVIDEPNRFGFAYGTLPGHVESGEERFLVSMLETGEVQYEILAFSRPHHWLVRLGYPLARLAQARFRRESCRSMAAAIRRQPVLT
ncbi:MAG: DUF1990 domain-containing protein [Gemmataceae bacterium]